MPKAYPWNSVKEPHHHDNTKCGPGSEIPAHNRVAGTGGKPLCKDCAKLNQVRIPAKPNADSEGKPNGIPG
jgi:hypothetical protein